MVEQLLTMQDVQDRLSISESLLYRLIREDPEFQTLKIRGARRMRESALAQWLEKQEANAA